MCVRCVHCGRRERLACYTMVLVLQFGGDFDVFAVERGQPVAVHGTSEFLFLAKHHVVVGRTVDAAGRCRSHRRVVGRRVVRRVRPAERAARVVGDGRVAGAVRRRPVTAAHARRPRRGRRLRAHRTVSVCNETARLAKELEKRVGAGVGSCKVNERFLSF